MEKEFNMVTFENNKTSLLLEVRPKVISEFFIKFTSDFVHKEIDSEKTIEISFAVITDGIIGNFGIGFELYLNDLKIRQGLIFNNLEEVISLRVSNKHFDNSLLIGICFFNSFENNLAVQIKRLNACILGDDYLLHLFNHKSSIADNYFVRLKGSKKLKILTDNNEIIQICINMRSEMKPFAMIRISDGEARILSHKNMHDSTTLSESIVYMLGYDFYANSKNKYYKLFFEKFLSFLSKKIADSILMADILGIPFPIHWNAESFGDNPKGALYSAEAVVVADEILSGILPVTPRFIMNAHHFRFNPDFNIDEIAKMFDRVFVVTQHHEAEIKPFFKNHDCLTVLNYPGHATFLYNELEHNLENSYTNIIQQMQHANVNTLFICACGLFGKIFCGEAKRLGASSIDVGVLFDIRLGIENHP
jgi:hypothetical protein